MIDIIRTSVSRPGILKKSHESFLQRVHYSGEFRFLLHEDVIKNEESIRCCNWAKENGYEVSVHYPPIGQGGSMCTLIDLVQTEFYLTLEDDWEFLRDIDLDPVEKLMKNNLDINQITWHKRPVMDHKGNFQKVHIVRDGIDLVVSPHWNMLPSLCRLSFIKPFFKDAIDGIDPNFNWTLNAKIKGLPHTTTPLMRDHEWVQQNMGTYFFGKHGEETFIFHLGGGFSVREGQYK